MAVGWRGQARSRGRRGLAVAAMSTVIVASGCQSAQPSARRPPTRLSSPVSPKVVAPSTSTTTQASGCTDASVIAAWSVRRRAAQLVAAPVLDYSSATVGQATAEGVGGLLLLGSATAPADLASSLQAASREPAGDPPPLVMADEEGGGVQRLVGPVSSIPWPRQLAASLSPGQVQALATTVAQQMRQLGVTMDLAPVLDVDGGQGPNDRDPDGQRSFSANPTVAAQYGVAFLKGLEAGGVIPVVKHFPGLGGASGDTDSGPASTLPLATLQAAGLRPFQAAIGAGAPAVMIANASVPGLTSAPASLSSGVIQGLLEGTLGFSGLVLTDSLSAGAIGQTTSSLGAAAAAAVAAGADLVLFGSTIDTQQQGLLTPGQVDASIVDIVDAIAGAVSAGTVSTQRLDDAVSAVLNAKHADLCAAG